MYFISSTELTNPTIDINLHRCCHIILLATPCSNVGFMSIVGFVNSVELMKYGLHHKKVSVALPYNVRRTLKRCKKNRVRTLYERKAGVCVERPN